MKVDQMNMSVDVSQVQFFDFSRERNCLSSC